MNDDFIVPGYVVIDTVMQALDHHSHRLAHISDAEVLTVAVVAARSFQNYHERALQVLHGMGYLSGKLSTSRFNRRLHALGAWFRLLLETLGALLARGEAFIIASMPVPACRRARARRCRTVRGAAYCGYCAAKGGEVLRLALASGLHRGRRARRLRPAARELARADLRLAGGGQRLRGQGLQQPAG